MPLCLSENYNFFYEYSKKSIILLASIFTINALAAQTDSQYVRINYPGHKVQAFFITPYYGSSVKVITGTGQTVVKESNTTEQKGLNLHGVYFDALQGNDYYIVIKNASKKYDNSLLIYGLKK